MKIFLPAVFLFMAAFPLTAISSENTGQPVYTDLFVGGKGGYKNYRIPAIVVTPKGTVLAFCEGRKKHKEDWGKPLFENSILDPRKSYFFQGRSRFLSLFLDPIVEKSTFCFWRPSIRCRAASKMAFQMVPS